MREQMILSQMKRMALAFFCLLGLVSSAGAQQAGVIEGNLSDEKGVPVAGATIFATPSKDTDTIEVSSQSDNRGRFVMANLKWGKYTVTAAKIDAGYPRTPSLFYGTGNPPVLELSPAHTKVETTIAFRGKAPMLAGLLIDDEASVPISGTILLRYAKDPGNILSVETGPNYRVLVPANVPLTLEVSSEGYKTWYYPGTNDFKKKTHLELKPEQVIKLNIRLDGEFEDCACLDRPQRWGVGPDSPGFQWHDLQDESLSNSCARHSRAGTVAQLIVTAR